MASPINSWNSPKSPLLSSIPQNPILRSSNMNISSVDGGGGHGSPVLPPLPGSVAMPTSTNSYMPYSNSFNGMGYGTYGSYAMPYRSSPYTSYGGYGGYSGYGFGSFGMDDAERRFIQYAEERSRHAFASVESIVRVFNSISMMLDNTFFAMTSSFRAVLSVAENFGKLRNMFGHIWHSVNLFRLFNYLYRKLMWLVGRKESSGTVSMAWSEAMRGALPEASPGGSSWPTLAFLGLVISVPYIISKFLPKYNDKNDPCTWKMPGVKAKAAFNFIPRSNCEMSLNVNDIITLAPTYIQEEMNLKNSGWAFAVDNTRSGLVPLNHLVIMKPAMRSGSSDLIVPRMEHNNNSKASNIKRVSFGENQIFDLDDYVSPSNNINRSINNIDQNNIKQKNPKADTNETINNSNDNKIKNNSTMTGAECNDKESDIPSELHSSDKLV